MVATEQTASPFGWGLINDLSSVSENEDVILDYLLDRLQRGQIYTWIGSLLLALNPCNEVSTSNLYSVSEIEKYINTPEAAREEATPHIFTVVAKAHYSLSQQLGNSCQVIIVSGGTGTGKTFNACKCLEFLNAVNKNPEALCRGDGCTDNIAQKITDACRLISAFTTASTERNEVSSRHGQLVRLHYKGGIISGATVDSFLLERTRVTKGANNFQIFYQMIFGMSDAELQRLDLLRDNNYDILSTVDCTRRKCYQETFQDTLEVFRVLGFEVGQIEQIFQVVALLVHMGNIEFLQGNDTCVIDVGNKKSKEALESTCTLSGLEEADVIELLTKILINPQSTWRKYTTYHRNLITIEACRNRLHSIIRHIYDLLFHWILERVNRNLSAKQQCSQWLGILDIFGFESFAENGIEQLCVNYANERMQQYFMKSFLETSRKDLQEEGFIGDREPLNAVHVYDQRLIVLEQSLFAILNDASQSPVPVNASKVIQLACGTNGHNLRRGFLKEKDETFIVEHFSGPIAYSVNDLLSKNSDKIPTETSLTFNASTNKFLRSLINIKEESHLCAIKESTKKRTMLAKLKYSIDTLIKELSKCELHYVRCVKPSRAGCNWDRDDFKTQLNCAGVFDALPLAKCKYPVRLSYEDFCKRYARRFTEISDFNDKCRTILECIATNRELRRTVHYGQRLIFLTETMFLKLEQFRRNYRMKCANKVQSVWRKYRRDKNLPISKYADQESDNSLEEKSSSEIDLDDDVFVNSPILQQCKNDTTDDPVKTNDLNVTEEFDKHLELANKNVSLAKSKKFDYSSGISQERFTNYSCNIIPEIDDSYVIDCLRLVVKHMKGMQCAPTDHNCNNNIEVNCNNNFVPKRSSKYDTLKNSSTETESAEAKRALDFLAYNKERDVYTIRVKTGDLHYKNRILSKRQLAAVPVKVHTRPTLLPNAHMLPRSEIPQGLQDCL